MPSYLARNCPSVGIALFRSADPPDASAFEHLRHRGIDVELVHRTDAREWALALRHPEWGGAAVGAGRDPAVPSAFVLAASPAQTAAERAALTGVQSGVTVVVHGTRGNVLEDRKVMLRWLRVVIGGEGVAGFDYGSQHTWSPEALDEELAHPGPLDVEALYVVHGVTGPLGGAPRWVHTHGLASVGAFDFDILRPAENLGTLAPIVRGLAVQILEGAVARNAPRHLLTLPDGYVAMVPVAEFMARASRRDRGLRDAAESHATHRSVVCDPRSTASCRPPQPARLLSRLKGHATISLSSDARDLLTDRARATFPRLRALEEEFREFRPEALVQLAIQRDSFSTPDSTEHLWFLVHAFGDGVVDATLVSRPYDVQSLREGDRGWHPIDSLSDWILRLPFGDLTPRTARAERCLREKREQLRWAWKKLGPHGAALALSAR